MGSRNADRERGEVGRILRSVLEEIARNKRRSVIVIVLFVLVWAGIGALIGGLFGSNSSSPVGGIVTGIVIAALIAVSCAVYAYTSGSRLVLAVSGRGPPTRSSTASCTTSSRRWRSAPVSPSPPST